RDLGVVDEEPVGVVDARALAPDEDAVVDRNRPFVPAAWMQHQERERFPLSLRHRPSLYGPLVSPPLDSGSLGVDDGLTGARRPPGRAPPRPAAPCAGDRAGARRTRWPDRRGGPPRCTRRGCRRPAPWPTSARRRSRRRGRTARPG